MAPDPDLPLSSSLGPLPAGELCGMPVRQLHILRDPYNNWASRVAANERVKAGGRALTSLPSWELFRTNWFAIADKYKLQPEDVILFNRWARSETYRQQVASRLGRENNSLSLEEVAREGTGSSFDSLPRPSYLKMLSRLPFYFSREFRQRLFARPGHYFKRFVSPPIKASEMKLEERWHFLLQREDCQPVFADRELREAAREIFSQESLPPAG